MNGFENSVGDWLTVVRAVHFAATAIMVGLLLFRTVVAEPALWRAPATAQRVAAQTLRGAWIGLAVSVVSGVAWILVQAPAMSGLPFAEAMTDGVIGTVVTETRFGMVSEIRCALAVLVAVGLCCDRYPVGRTLALASSVFLVAAIAATGHAGATEGTIGVVHLTGDAVHLVAASAWLGGLVGLTILIAAARRGDPATWPELVLQATARFSWLGILSVGALLATGMVSSVILVGSLRALIGSKYGQLLMFKIVLVAVMLAFAAINRFLLMPGLASVPDRAFEAVGRLKRNAMIEIALGLIVFAIVGALGTIHPAIHLLPV
jgi:putative copper resistance protein D